MLEEKSWQEVTARLDMSPLYELALLPALAELLFYVMTTLPADADLEPTLSTANQFDLRTVDPQEWAGSFNESLESPPRNDTRLQISVRLGEKFGHRGRCALADDLDGDHTTQGTSRTPY